jgi:very-short-patch-repair endonuclease
VFPAWLPGTHDIDGFGGANVAAARALARHLAARTPHFAPFLADLAERALTRAPTAVEFAPEVRAAGLARVLAESSRRPRLALLVGVPDDLPATAERVLVGACEWLAHRGQVSVCLIGARPATADWIETVAVSPPQPAKGRQPPPPTCPARAGKPHPASLAEKALEAALALRPWAVGREWNQTYQPHALANRICPDLLWRAERLVVEVDGPEHYGGLKYADDRRRDMELQFAGFAVLRFMNAQVLNDTQTVISHIERFLIARRRTA